MPTYRITTPGGLRLNVTGDAPPSQEDLNQIFLKVGADQSIAGAEAGREARNNAPTADGIPIWPMRGEDGEQITPEVATQKAMAGLAVPVLVGGLETIPTTVAGAGRLALGFAGAEMGSRYGAPLAAKVGLPPEAGAVVGGLVGAIAPEAALARMAGRAGVSMALSARLAHTLNREAPEAVAAAGKVLQFGRASSSLPSEMAAALPRTAQGTTAAARALEGAGLSPELATAEAAKMGAATGEVADNLPGVMTPAGGTAAVKMPAITLAEDIQAQVAKLRASGLSKAQITAAVREKHNLEAEAAGKVVDTIFEHSGSRQAATAESLPAGSRVMPPYRGGKAQPYAGPARVPTSDADLLSLLRQSLDAYKLP